LQRGRDPESQTMCLPPGYPGKGELCQGGSTPQALKDTLFEYQPRFGEISVGTFSFPYGWNTVGP